MFNASNPKTLNPKTLNSPRFHILDDGDGKAQEGQTNPSQDIASKHHFPSDGKHRCSWSQDVEFGVGPQNSSIRAVALGLDLVCRKCLPQETSLPVPSSFNDGILHYAAT